MKTLVQSLLGGRGNGIPEALTRRKPTETGEERDSADGDMFAERGGWRVEPPLLFSISLPLIALVLLLACNLPGIDKSDN